MACSGHLWAVDNSGIIRCFNVRDSSWSALEYDKIEFKRLSTTPWGAWAVGGDLQIYLYVQARDIPIRETLTTYENQRWVPIKGFGADRLPTDRPLWSNAKGTVELKKESFKLPSKNWFWEDEWLLKDNIEGEPLSPECWTYAIDFPMEYGPERNWNSLVRRRKWLRNMRYVALNRWVLIESLHDDHALEPFIDISCGGYDLPGNEGKLCVWAVTIVSRVLVREGVDNNNPEGIRWMDITTNDDKINQVSVGPTGLVWTVTWDGNALVRTGVTRDTPYGTNWIEVEPPKNAKLMQVSVGVNAVWAISRDHRVWFRKGVRGFSSGLDETCATGSGWIEMVSEMSAVSVSPNDQVYAIDVEKKHIYFRTDISSGEFTGKSWKVITNSFTQENNRVIEARMRLNTNSDSESISSMDSVSTSMDSSALLTGDDGIGWSWLSASAVNLNADMYISGLVNSVSENLNTLAIETDVWRQLLRSKLHQRHEKEMKSFIETFPYAIEKGTWIKSGQALKLTKSNQPLLCQLELERHGAERGTESGTLICSYSSSHNKKSVEKIVINLAAIACIHVQQNTAHKNYSNTLIIHINKGKTIEQVFSVIFQSDKDLDDWFTTLNVAASNIQEYESTLGAHPLVWCITDYGAVYACHSHERGYFFRHVGDGDFQSVETCSAGLTWSLTPDNRLFYFTNGSGGGVYKSISGANSATFPFECARTYKLYENHRWNPLTGFAAKGLPTDRPMWSDKSGKVEMTKEDMRPPSKAWQWVSDWTIDYSTPGGVDDAGWQYAVDFPFEYHPEKSFTDYARRRRWYRRCKISTSGPWKPIESPTIVSMSLFSYVKESTESEKPTEHVHGWAISEDGDALCRSGITLATPQGTSWIHVPCNQKLKWISVGGDPKNVKVWAVARDGSVCMRNGVSGAKTNGLTWFYIEPPRTKNSPCSLRQISVGGTSVFGLDKKGRMWIREDVVATFPEGTKWRNACDSIRHISLSDDDQFCVILSNQDKHTVTNELVFRKGVSSESELGTEWTHLGITIFNYVSFR